MRISDWSSDVCSSDLDLIFNQTGSLARIVRTNDHLDIREVRQGIDGCGPHRPEAGERNHDRSQHDEQPVGDRAFDDPVDHCPLACLISLMRALLSSRSEEHTSELQSLMRISYAVFCLKKKNKRQ